MSCESSLPDGAGSRNPPTLSPGAVRAAGLNLEDVADAQTLYAIKCAKCHQFYNPNAYAAREWDKWMRKMSGKAKLQPAQEELLARYLAAFRQQPADAHTSSP
jgi:hypothetical protein